MMRVFALAAAVAVFAPRAHALPVEPPLPEHGPSPDFIAPAPTPIMDPLDPADASGPSTPAAHCFIDLRAPALDNLPPWIGVSDPETEDGTARIAFQIAAPKDVGDLAFTIHFHETNGAALRVVWRGTDGPLTLSENLCEGIGLPNHRVLLVPRALIGALGTLVIESADDTLPVDSVACDWTLPTLIAAAPGALVPGLLCSDGRLLSADEVDGQPAFAEEDRWDGRTVSAPLSPLPERVDGAFGYEVDIAERPLISRLETYVIGPAPGVPVRVWINGQSAGVLAIETPDLLDPAYTVDGFGRPSYRGWRRATLLVPHGLIDEGSNVVQLTVEDTMNAVAPLAVKHLTLQLRFPDAGPDVQRLAPPRPELR